MKFLRKADTWKEISSISFMLFLFLLVIFTGIGKAKVFFYVAVITMIVFAVINKGKIINASFIVTPTFLIITAFLLYYSITNLWSDEPLNIFSTIKHSFYLLFFIYMVDYCIARYGRIKVHSAIFLGCFVLLSLTLYLVDKQNIFVYRLGGGFFAAPSNVIDLGGYFAIGIFSGLIIARESGRYWIYLPCALLFIGLMLTQSRGPLLSLIIALALALANYRNFQLKKIMYALIALLAIGIFFTLTSYGNEFAARLLSSYNQSFIRFGIWEHAIKETMIKPFFGWGFDQEIKFINSIGAPVTTTHSLYVGSFLKGGTIGICFLAALIVSALIHAYRKFKSGLGLESAVWIFSLLFYTTQGMFVVGGPAEMWVLFWLPLALVVSRSKTAI